MTAVVSRTMVVALALSEVFVLSCGNATTRAFFFFIAKKIQTEKSEEDKVAGEQASFGLRGYEICSV